MTYQIQQWPEEVIELNRELATEWHPRLRELMHGLSTDSPFAERLGHIAAYCDLVLDGQYMPEEIAGICGQLVTRLKAKRELPPSQTILQLH